MGLLRWQSSGRTEAAMALGLPDSKCRAARDRDDALCKQLREE